MNGNLIDCLKWTLLFGKFVGVIPLVDLWGDGKNIRFEWKTTYMFVYTLCLAILIFMVITQIVNFICFGYDGLGIISLVFYGVNLTLLLLFLRFCIRFKDFAAKIRALENLLPPLKKSRSTIKFICILMGINIITGLAEHIGFVMYTFHITYACYLLPDDSGWFLKSYFVIFYGWYYKFFPFSYVPAFIFQIIKVQSGIVWFYSDMFVMIVCVYLKNRFQDFNRLILDKDNMFTRNFKPTWSELQVHYTRISQLVTVVDNHINGIVFVSYVSNLYHLCLQIYFTLNNLTNSNNSSQGMSCLALHSRNDAGMFVFKWLHTMPLLMRTSLISYLASEVNVVSRKPLMAMHTIPSSAIGTDVQRFMTQVYYSKLGLSGLNFFLITRGSILAMIAQLLTYEMVVVQI